MYEDRVKLSRLYLLYFPKNKSSKSVIVRPGRFIVSASPKMVIKLYFNFFLFSLKVLELSEYRRGNPYMTANIKSSSWDFSPVEGKLIIKLIFKILTDTNDPEKCASPFDILLIKNMQ